VADPFPPVLVAVKVILEVVAFPVGVPLITPVCWSNNKPEGRGEAMKLDGVGLPVIV
jgi:hypothetical protein